jgi:hypothetical protein
MIKDKPRTQTRAEVFQHSVDSEKQEGEISRELHCDQNFPPAISMGRISRRRRIFLSRIFLLVELEQENAGQEYTDRLDFSLMRY